jgi:hypothetical protein
MALVVDGIAAWLVAALGDASRKKLTEVVLGDDFDRALDSAARAAVQRTVTDVSSDDNEAAEHLARVIDEVFANPLSRSVPEDSTESLSELLNTGIAAQLAVLDDASLTGIGSSSSDVLGVPTEVLVEQLTSNLSWVIKLRGARGGPLASLADQINHERTHDEQRQLKGALDEIREALRERFVGLESTASPGERDVESTEDAFVRAEQLLDNLELGDHDEAQRRVDDLFVHLSRAQQRAVVEAIIEVATSTADDLVHHHASSLLEAADRLDPRLIRAEEVEAFARSKEVALRMSAAMLMWQHAESDPGRVSISLLGRLAHPSKEDWYVQAPARAAAKQLLLRRAATRAIFDRMAASHDVDDREYAARDLLEVAEVEPRAVPRDLAERLAGDREEVVAALGTSLRRALEDLDAEAHRKYFGAFGL